MMNTPYLIQAVEALDAALGATINEEHRLAIARAAKETLFVLRAEGIFLGISRPLNEIINEINTTKP